MQMIEADNIGKELIQRGWSQGSMVKFDSASSAYLVVEKPLGDITIVSTFSPSMRWHMRQAKLDREDFIVISQPCDIQKSPKQEPFVAVMPVFLTDDTGIIHDASRNSIRYFLLRRLPPIDGQQRSLIVDATVHLLLDKPSLLHVTPLAGIQENDKVTLRLFRRWLARRYDRPALDDDLVNAVQKPILKAIGKLRSTHPLHTTLDGIGEVLFLLQNNALPYQIMLLFIRDERSDAPHVSYEQAADLASWLDGILRDKGNAELSNWQIFSTDEISLKVYTDAYKLSLDQYSLHLDEVDTN